MDVTLHKRCAKFIYVIPEGLRELMSDISREVIRTQPEYIYTFIADYLDALMITRENARVAARLVDSIIQIATMTVELLQQTGMSREEADRMANIIQDAFKRYMAIRQEPIVYTSVQEEEEEEHQLIIDILHQFGDFYDQDSTAIPIIQRAFREFKIRHQREKQLLTGMIDWRVAARSAIYLYRHTGVTMEEANRAATLIKAAYKGYYTRRIMKRLLEEGQRMYDEQEEMVHLDHVEIPSEEEFSEMEGEVDVGLQERPSFIARGVLQDVLKKVVPDDDAGTAPPTTSDLQQTAPPASAEPTYREEFGEDGEVVSEAGATTATEPISEVTTEGEGGVTESEGEAEEGGGQGAAPEGEPPAEGGEAGAPPAEGGEAAAPAEAAPPAEGEAPPPAEGEAPADAAPAEAPPAEAAPAEAPPADAAPAEAPPADAAPAEAPPADAAPADAAPADAAPAEGEAPPPAE